MACVYHKVAQVRGIIDWAVAGDSNPGVRTRCTTVSPCQKLANQLFTSLRKPPLHSRCGEPEAGALIMVSRPYLYRSRSGNWRLGCSASQTTQGMWNIQSRLQQRFLWSSLNSMCQLSQLVATARVLDPCMEALPQT